MLWFKAKQYGYGWYPATWQGWLVLVIYLGIILWSAFTSFDTNTKEVTPAQVWRFIAIDGVATILLIVIAWKTGEPAKWRWGKK
ncbi:MAG: hypothetical protein AAB515_03090 [Patescibacteria group bacterium]